MKATGNRRGRQKQDRRFVRINVSVDPDDYAEMEGVGRETGLSVSFLIRKGMKDLLAEYRKGGVVAFKALSAATKGR